MFSPIKKNLSKKILITLVRGALASVLAVSVWLNHAVAKSDQDWLLQAKEAYQTKNEVVLTEAVSRLKSNQYVLAPYADYWLMLLKLNQTENAEILAFIQHYSDVSFSDRLRGEWLKKLAHQQDWIIFYEQLAHFKREDIAVQCYALLGKKQAAENAQSYAVDVEAETRKLWLTSVDLPSNCTDLFDVMQKSGALTLQDIWARYRLALQEGKLGLAKSIATRLPEVDDDSLKLLDAAYEQPNSLLENKFVEKKIGRKKTPVRTELSLQTRAGIETSLYALDRLARQDLPGAIKIYNRFQYHLPSADRAFGWGRVALYAARSHHPNALKYFELAKDVSLDKEQLAWRVRAALRAGDWNTVSGTIAMMQPAQRQEGAWRYWKARALKEHGMLAESNVLMAQLSKERHYYGWLAAEELESVLGNEQGQYTANDTEIAAVASQPAVKRAWELQQLDMRWEAKAEWVWATRDYDDKQLIAAAAYAMRQKWYDIAITTADNTKSLHDFSLRYPTPYRDLFRAAALNESVDEAWIYGLTRQESRFMHYAKSGVGASGLMQIMPATAKWAAKRMGLTDYRQDNIHDLPTNVGIGTYYMRYTLELMGGQAVMATAAYNAGPSRAKRWLASEPLETAIYIETIPFSETRNYVQKVMTNAQMYAPRLGAPMQSLKTRLGIMPASDKPQVVLADYE